MIAILLLIVVVVLIGYFVFYNSEEDKSEEKDEFLEKIKKGDSDGIDPIEYIKMRQSYNFGEIV